MKVRPFKRGPLDPNRGDLGGAAVLKGITRGVRRTAQLEMATSEWKSRVVGYLSIVVAKFTVVFVGMAVLVSRIPIPCHLYRQSRGAAGSNEKKSSSEPTVAALALAQYLHLTDYPLSS